MKSATNTQEFFILSMPILSYSDDMIFFVYAHSTLKGDGAASKILNYSMLMLSQSPGGQWLVKLGT